MALITNISSKYRDIVSKCVQIQNGPPAVYQLKPKVTKFGTLTKKTFGEKNQNMCNKNILLVGETGSGKSTLINALVNYNIGVNLEDNIWFEIVEDEQRSQTESQTSDVIVYEILGFKGLVQPYYLTIIDTPGYGDTRGIEHDDKLKERLLDLFRSPNGVHELHTVGLVMKASDNRLNDRLMYIINSITSLFGKDMDKIIVILITNSNGVTAKNVLQAVEKANIKCALNKKNQPAAFLFDNCQRTEKTEENELGIENSWRVTERGMKQFSEFLQNVKPQTLERTAEVLNTIVQVTACIQNLKDKIEHIEEQQQKTQETQKFLNKHKAEMEKNQNFVITRYKSFKEKKSIKCEAWFAFYEGAVVCKNCEENCHYPQCTMALYPRDCAVMSRGKCTSCSRKCPVSCHVKEQWIYVPRLIPYKITCHEMLTKYNQNKTAVEEKKNILQILDEEMTVYTKERDCLLNTVYECILKLEEIALNINSVSTFVDYDFIIERMREKKAAEKIQKLEVMKVRMNQDKRVMDGLRYKISKLGK